MNRARRRKTWWAKPLAYLFLGGLAFVFGRWVVVALLIGETVLGRNRTAQLSEEPIWFWVGVAWNAAFALACLFFLGRAAIADVKRLLAS